MRGQGNDMAGTLPRDIGSSAFPNHLHGRPGHPRAEQSAHACGQSPSPDPAALLAALLNAAPVDLCRVSEEMRAHPDLQALVVELAGYLSFLPDTSGTTIEEAVVVVGTDRLRVLVYLWSLLRQRRGGENFCAPAESRTSSGNSAEASPRRSSALRGEIACLADFLESLGLDSVVSLQRPAPVIPSESQEAEFFELTDVLARDIISFIPLIEPAFRKRQKSAVTVARNSSGKETE